MMTTMAALLGALPLAFGAGVGSELRRPLGITIVGGLLVSQALTLYTTPVIYLYLDRLARWGRGYAFALFEAPDAPDPADVVGVGEAPPERDADAAVVAVLHDAPAPAEPDAEALALAHHALAGWRQRTAGPPPG